MTADATQPPVEPPPAQLLPSTPAATEAPQAEAPASEASVAEARGRRLDWRLLVGAALLVCLLLGWGISTMQYYSAQRRSANQITAIGGRAYLESAVPPWLTFLFGNDALQRVVRVDFEGVPIVDADLALIDPLVELRGLFLSKARVTDQGIRHLKNLRRLELLDLSGTSVTDQGLAYLESLPRLETLSLNQTRVSDAGLAHLKGLKNLQLVELNAMQVSDEGVNELRKALPNVQILH